MEQRSVLAAMSALAMMGGITTRGERIDVMDQPSALPQIKPSKDPKKGVRIQRAPRSHTAKTTRSKWNGKAQPPTMRADTRQWLRYKARVEAKRGVPKSKRRPPYPGR
jgi:hypothetical protein